MGSPYFFFFAFAGVVFLCGVGVAYLLTHPGRALALLSGVSILWLLQTNPAGQELSHAVWSGCLEASVRLNEFPRVIQALFSM